MSNDIDLFDAIALVEGLGYKVIPADWVKEVSFHVAVKDEILIEGLGEEYLSRFLDQKDKAFETQLNDLKAIKYSTRVDPYLCSTVHSWRMKVIV